MEGAAGGRVNGRRDVAFEDNSFSFLIWIYDWDRRQKRLRVGMFWIQTKFLGFSRFNDTTQIHDKNAAADVLYHCQIVSDKEISQSMLLLKVFQQVDDLSLD